MKFPAIIVNFKTYEQSTGKNAVKLAMICDSTAKKQRKNIIIAVQAADISSVAKAVKIPVFSQHVDNISFGKNTGFILPEAVKAAGASGTLLNHAEHKLDYKVLKATIDLCRKLKLTTVVCAADNKEAKIVAKMNPDIIAVEPPELIGSGIPVSQAKPKFIINAVKAVHKIKKIPVICGAGIGNGNDVRKALELGTVGVLPASAITTAKNPGKVVEDMANGLITKK